jgi:hypothetical protein
MARSDTRFSVYPAARAVEIVGDTAPDLNLAIECWASLLKRAMAHNDSRFSKGCKEGSGPYHYLHDWAVMAEALRGKRFDPDYAKPGELLATAVEDAHMLEMVGERYYEPYPEDRFDLNGDIIVLVGKLRALNYEQAWAVIRAVDWLWEHCSEGIDIKKDDWWTLAFRRQWNQKRKEAQPQRMIAEVDQMRQELQRTRIRQEQATLRLKGLHAERAKLNEQFKAAEMRLKQLKRRQASDEQKEGRSQLEQARAAYQETQSALAAVEEQTRLVETEAKQADEKTNLATRRVEQLEKICAEFKFAREQLVRSEQRLKELERESVRLLSGE